MEASPESGAACVLEALLSLGPEPLTAHGSHSELCVMYLFCTSLPKHQDSLVNRQNGHESGGIET